MVAHDKLNDIDMTHDSRTPNVLSQKARLMRLLEQKDQREGRSD